MALAGLTRALGGVLARVFDAALRPVAGGSAILPCQPDELLGRFLQYNLEYRAARGGARAALASAGVLPAPSSRAGARVLFGPPVRLSTAAPEAVAGAQTTSGALALLADFPLLLMPVPAPRGAHARSPPAYSHLHVKVLVRPASARVAEPLAAQPPPRVSQELPGGAHSLATVPLAAPLALQPGPLRPVTVEIAGYAKPLTVAVRSASALQASGAIPGSEAAFVSAAAAALKKAREERTAARFAARSSILSAKPEPPKPLVNATAAPPTKTVDALANRPTADDDDDEKVVTGVLASVLGSPALFAAERLEDLRDAARLTGLAPAVAFDVRQALLLPRSGSAALDVTAHLGGLVFDDLGGLADALRQASSVRTQVAA